MPLAAALALGAPAAPAGAAVVQERSVEVQVRGDAVTTTETLVVDLDSPADLEDWSEYPIYLNRNRELVSCTAEVLEDGKAVERVPRRAHIRRESQGFGLYNSAWTSTIPFTQLAEGRRIRIIHTVREKPYFPADQVMVGLHWPQFLLKVRVEAPGRSLRWRLDRSPADLQPRQTAEGVLELEARGLPAHEPARFAPSPASVLPVLRLGWDGMSDWTHVGRWYESLLAGMPPVQEGVDVQAREIAAHLPTPREKLEALTFHVKRRIRYVAVEVGVGGYVPTPPAEVLGRAWGDCKDKAQLLRRMLAAVGVPGHMALIRTGEDGLLDAAFPSPFQFNHAILAVPADAAGAKDGDPVAGGYLFVDPTWEEGGVAWLPPADRGRAALVVDGEASRLVEIPEDPGAELVSLEVTGRVTLAGALEGELTLELGGARAAHWLSDLAAREQERTEEDLHSVVNSALPGVRLDAMRWEPVPGSRPGLRLMASVTQDALVRGEAGRRGLTLKGLSPFPAAHHLADRKVPVLLDVGTHVTRFRFTLPESWCPASPAEDAVDNDQGRLTIRVGMEPDGVLLVEREAMLRRSRVEPADLPDLEALAIADGRANRRTIRLRCP